MSKEKLGHWASPRNYCRDNIIKSIRWELIGIKSKEHLFWVGLAVKRGFLNGHRLRSIHFWFLPALSARFVFLGAEYDYTQLFQERNIQCQVKSLWGDCMLLQSVTVHRHWPEGFHFENCFWTCSSLLSSISFSTLLSLSKNL